jgi:hypothetical protein
MSYHGTPHKIDPREGFRMDKIGTGEGAQVYGYGLYFAGVKSTAEYYRDTLTDPSQIPLHFDGRPLNTPWTNEIRERWSDYYQSLNEIDADAMDELLSNLSQADDISAISDVLSFVSSKAKSLYQRIVKPKLSKPDLGAGNLYTVELLPDANDLLDWDQPLAEQSEKVKAAILKIMAGGDQDLEAILDLSPDGMMMMGMIPSAKGSAAYQTIGDPQKASEKTLVDFYNDMLVLLDRLFMLAVGIKASITNFILSVQDPRTHTKQTECKHKLEQILMDFRGDEKVDAIFEQILKRYDKYIS